jgi:hypothetical protein
MRKLLIVLILVGAGFLALPRNLWGSTFTDWPELTLGPEEALEVTFTLPCDASSVKEDTVWVSEDESGEAPLGVQVVFLDEDHRKLRVLPPEGGWPAGRTYFLFLGSALRSQEGVPLGKPVRLPFRVLAPEGTEPSVADEPPTLHVATGPGEVLQAAARALDALDFVALQELLSSDLRQSLEGDPEVSEEEARKVAQALREARKLEVSSDEARYEMTVDGVTYPIILRKEGEEWKIERF